jgi:hypothetical protein
MIGTGMGLGVARVRGGAPGLPRSGLILDLNADLITGVADTQPAGTFPDGSGLANHGTAAGALRGIYLATGANGRPAVQLDGVDDTYGLASAITTARTFYVVMKYAGTTGLYPLLGGTATFDFHPNAGTTVYDGSFTSAGILTGSNYLNGVSTAALSINKPTSLALISCVAASALSFNNVSNDRATAGRWTPGTYARIVAYNLAHDAATLAAVHALLNARYAIF